jgi:hypothetical protein
VLDTIGFNPGWELAFSPGFLTEIADPRLKAGIFSLRSHNQD